MRLALRYRSRDALWRHIKDTGTLYLEIVDYPGEWLLDLPMLEQDYLSWSRQMLVLLQEERATWAAPWLSRCAGRRAGVGGHRPGLHRLSDAR